MTLSVLLVFELDLIQQKRWTPNFGILWAPKVNRLLPFCAYNENLIWSRDLKH